MKCFCRDCGKVFHEDDELESNLLGLFGTECPEWAKKAFCHYASTGHDVVVVTVVSLEKLASSLGMSRELILSACLAEGIRNEAD